MPNNLEQAASETPTVPVKATHPSIYILGELFERDWSIGELAWRMLAEPNNDNDANRKAAARINSLALQMYILCWPDEPTASLGDDLAAGMARAFGTSTELFLNLERAYLAARNRTACRATRGRPALRLA